MISVGRPLARALSSDKNQPVKYVVTCVAGMISGALGYGISERLQWTRLEQRVLMWAIAAMATAFACGLLWA